MQNLQKAYFDFWGQFALPVYLDGYAVVYDEEGNVKPPPLPYITFSFSRNEILTSGLMTARVWTYSESFLPVTKILDEIEKAVPQRGTILKFDGGAVTLYRGTPFIQYQPMPDDEQMFKVGYVNIEARSYVL